MGRLIAILLGGAALAFYVPALLGGHVEAVDSINKFWRDLLPSGWYGSIGGAGGGIFAGIALVLLAVRGKE